MKKGNFVFSLHLEIGFVEGIRNDVANISNQISVEKKRAMREVRACATEFIYESRATVACVTTRG